MLDQSLTYISTSWARMKPALTFFCFLCDLVITDLVITPVTFSMGDEELKSEVHLPTFVPPKRTLRALNAYPMNSPLPT